MDMKTRPAKRSPTRDEAGHLWMPFENAYRQRMLRCVEGPRKGEEIHDPRTMAVPPEPRAAYQPPLDPWLAGLYKSDFFD